MYEIIREINDTAFVGYRDKKIYLLKKIHLEETELYKKLSGLDCANVLKVYELTTVEDSFYAVCEYVNGLTLRERVESGGVFDEAAAVKIMRGLCDGLNAVHSLGIVHRDINPNNVMLTEDGRVVIIDFGISRIRKAAAGADTCILGTQGYAAPEQYGFTQTGPGADIYAAGVLLNYLLTGCLPSEKHARGRLGEIIGKCTRMDENARYRNVLSLKSALTGNTVTKWIRHIPGFRRGNIACEAAAGLYYAAAALFVLLLAFSEQKPDSSLSSAQMAVFVGILLFLPVPVIGNAWNWTEKWTVTKNRSRAAKLVYRIVIAAALSFGVGIVILLL